MIKLWFSRKRGITVGCNNDYCDIKEYPEERNLDGCYFRVNRDGRWCNICFSDLTKEERTNVLSGKEAPWLISLCDHLGDKLHQIGDQFDIVSAD